MLSAHIDKVTWCIHMCACAPCMPFMTNVISSMRWLPLQVMLKV